MLLGITILVYLVGSKCASSPYLPEYRSLLEQFSQGIPNYNAYVLSKPQDASLLTCTQFNKQSCCTLQTEESFEAIVQAYKSYLNNIEYPLTSLINDFQTSLGKCGMKSRVTFEQSNGELLAGYNTLIEQVILLKTGFLRGNLCILCATYDNKDYIDAATNKTILNMAAYTAYKNDLSKAYEQIGIMVKPFRNYLLLFYTQNADTLACSQYMEEFLSEFSDLQVCPGNDCGASISATTHRLDTDPLYRLMSEDDYFLYVQNSGLLPYLPESTQSSWTGILGLGTVLIMIYS